MRPDPQKIRHVACIGAGTIGAGWAAYFLSRGLSVAVTDPGPGAEALLHRIIDGAWPSLEALGLAAGADRSGADTGDMANRLGIGPHDGSCEVEKKGGNRDRFWGPMTAVLNLIGAPKSIPPGCPYRSRRNAR